MTVRARVRSLGALSSRWLRADFPPRRRAVSDLVRRSGFTQKMAEEMLDALFSQLTESRLGSLLKAELGDPSVLDGFVKDAVNRRFVHAEGPAVILHIFSGNIPGAAVTSFILGLLAGSRNIGKLSGRDAGILGTWLESLKTHDRGLWKRCSAVRGRRPVARLAKSAGLVVAYGRDESLAQIRLSAGPKTPFIGYGHRVSIALILKEALASGGRSRSARMLARKTAWDVWMADQRGCLSPVLVLVQKGPKTAPQVFAGLVAEELAALEAREDAGPRRSLHERASMRRFADRAKIEALKGGPGAAWQSASGTWMAVYDERKDAEFSAGSQLIRIKGFSKLSGLEPVLAKMSGSLQAASLECAPKDRKKTARWLGSFGVNRICRAGKLQKPPVTWHHDGKLNLASWLNWVDLEV